jgi:hypothetical protein
MESGTERMRLKGNKSLIIYAVLLFYLCTPLLDGLVCAGCAGHVPFQLETAIGHMKTMHKDVSYDTKNEQHSNTDTEKRDQSFCSICANSIMNTDVYSVNPPVIIAQYHKPRALPLASELHYSIDKPPQNIFV